MPITNLYQLISESDNVEWKDLNPEIQEKLTNSDIIGLTKCNDCEEIIDTDSLPTKKVNMEDFYGVSGDFEDSHYQDIQICPNCQSTELQYLGLFDKDDFNIEQ